MPQFDPIRPSLLVSISPRFNTLSKCNYVSRLYTTISKHFPPPDLLNTEISIPPQKLVELEPIEIWNSVVRGSILGESVFLQHVLALVIL